MTPKYTPARLVLDACVVNGRLAASAWQERGDALALRACALSIGAHQARARVLYPVEVTMGATDLDGLMDRVGIQMNVIKSTRWDGSESFKDIGSPYRAMKPEERRFMQGEIRRMWERFVDVVATGRKGRLTRPEVARIADGRVWTGREALALKLIDSVGYREDAWHRAQELGKAPDARLVTWRAQGSLLGELIGARAPWTALETSLQETAAPVATSSPRLMYLWTGL